MNTVLREIPTYTITGQIMLYIFSEEPAFEDITLSILKAFISQGVSLRRIQSLDKVHPDDDLVIILGLNTLKVSTLPKNYIAYQLEQTAIDNSRPWFSDEYIKRLVGAREVWDYSLQNIVNIKSKLASQSIRCPSFRYVPITYLPLFDKGDETVEKEIDVLFYGSTNARRERMMMGLKKAGLRVHFAGYNLWGPKRIELVNKSRIVLNIHYYEDPILEATRLAPLVSQGAYVVSEPSVDRALDKFWSRYVEFVEYDSIVERCQNLIASDRQYTLREAHNNFRQEPFLGKHGLDYLIPWSKKKQEIPDNADEIETDETDETDETGPEVVSRETVKVKFRDAKLKTTQADDGAEIQTLALPDIPFTDLPEVTIVTPTYNRSELFPIAVRNFRRTIYPEDKLRWIIMDDSNEKHRAKNRELVKGDYRINYVEVSQKMSISDKRNYLADLSETEWIVHMDDDDYYNPESVLARIKLLLKYRHAGIRCVGCTSIGIYHLTENYSYLMDCKFPSEASMAYHRSFWEDQQFPAGEVQEGEGIPFVQNRQDQVLNMPYNFNFIAITHNKNVTGKLRTFNVDAEQKSTNFFNLWDFDTQLFFIKMSRVAAKK